MPLDLNQKFVAARHRLWKAQEKFNYYKDINIIINEGFTFNLKNRTCYHWPKFTAFGNPDQFGIEPYLKCFLKPEMLDGLLVRKYHWNNMEIGGWINFDRKPNVYDPDLHIIMSFFHV